MKIKKNILFVLSIVMVGVTGLVEANVKVANQTNETLTIRLNCITTGPSGQLSIASKAILPIIMTDEQFENCKQVEVLTADKGWHTLSSKFIANKDDNAHVLVIGQKE